MEPRCPTCGKVALKRPLNRFFPFCTERCRLVDLGKWMTEAYRVPGEPVDTEDGAPQPGREEDEE